MLGYTWVVSEKFSVFFSRDGYLFSTKFLYFSHEMGTFFQETFCIFCARWVPFCRNFLVYIPKGGCHLRRIFLYFPARWVSFKRVFAVFGFTEGRFPVSHISISPLSVNTSLIVGNHLWTVFNHYHLSSALALFANWLIKAASLSVQLVDLWSKDVYTIYETMLKSIHTTCQICAVCTLKFM